MMSQQNSDYGKRNKAPTSIVQLESGCVNATRAVTYTSQSRLMVPEKIEVMNAPKETAWTVESRKENLQKMYTSPGGTHSTLALAPNLLLHSISTHRHHARWHSERRLIGTFSCSSTVRGKI